MTDTSVTTVKATPLLVMPFTVTVIGPLVAEEGTGADILPALQLVTVAAVPLKETELEPWVAPNPDPLMVIEAPVRPDDEDRLLMTGVTVKLTLLLATPFTVTITGPVVAFVGTGTVMLPVFQLVAVAATPLNVSVLEPWLEPKLDPAMVTEVPTAPEVGERLLIVGDLPPNAGGAAIKARSKRREEKRREEPGGSFCACCAASALRMAEVKIRVRTVRGN